MLVVMFLTIALYIVTTLTMYDPELGESLNAMMESMPEMFAAFGMAEPSTTLIGFMLNYLYGFLLTLFPFILIVILANKLMVRYLDRGTMSYLLATPHSRTSIVCSLIAAFIALLAALMVLTTLTEIVSTELMFPGELDINELLITNIGLFALWIFLAGLCFLSACLFSHAGAALWVGAGLGIVFFLMQMIANVGEDFEFLNSFNPVILFDYYGLVAGDESAYIQTAVLAGLGIALFAVAVVVFNRRDLSV